LGSSFLVQIQNTKNKINRNFIVQNTQSNTVDFMALCRKYMALRSKDTPHERFFVQYRGNKCTIQPVGKNTLGSLPKKIAAFLNLPNPSLYTGHCFRRTSASLLSDSGATVDVLKRHGGWKSSTVAEGYVENSVSNKKKIADSILGHTNGPSTSTASSSTSSEIIVNHIQSNSSISDDANRLFNLVHCNNVTVNVNIYNK
jgi:integrase